MQRPLNFRRRKFDLWILVRQVDHAVAEMPLATLPPLPSSSLCVLSLRGRDDRAAGLCPRVPAAAGLRPCLPRPSLLARSVPLVVRMDWPRGRYDLQVSAQIAALSALL